MFDFPVFATLQTGAQTDEVRTNGQLFTCQAARLLPMARFVSVTMAEAVPDESSMLTPK